MSLFGEVEEISNVRGFSLSEARGISRKQLLEWEKELIGLYISKHPLSYLSEMFAEKVTHTTSEITEELDRQKVRLGGIIREARRITTKEGDTMCVVQRCFSGKHTPRKNARAAIKRETRGKLFIIPSLDGSIASCVSMRDEGDCFLQERNNTCRDNTHHCIPHHFMMSIAPLAGLQRDSEGTGA